MMLWVSRIILLVVSVIIVGSIIKIYRAMQLNRRIAYYSVAEEKEDVSFFDEVAFRYQKILQKFQNQAKLKKYAKRYERYLTIGDSVNPVTFILNKLVLAFLMAILVVVSYTLQGKSVSFLGIVVSFILGYYLYDVYLVYVMKHKKARIKNEMLRAVILMNNAFKAGKSTLQAVEIASRELPSPISYEFQKIYQDMAYGLSVDVAFGRFAKRVGLAEATYMASSLTILSKTGGNIVMVFSSIEKTLFDKKKLESDLKNSAAASNLVVKVLMVIPIVFVLLIYVISPNYFEPLFSSGLGYLVLFFMGMMFVGYLYLLNKIMKVRV